MKDVIVCVDWEDASSNSGYYDSKDEKGTFDPVPAKTVGHLLKKNKQKVVVASERFNKGKEDDDFRHIYVIPRKMIKSIVTLR